MATYDTILDYLNCSTGVAQKIEKLNNIISALEDALLKGALNGEVDEYSLDDGQTKIKQVFSSPESILKGIEGLERRKNAILNQNCIGRVIKLRDKDSFNLSKNHGY